MDAVFFCLVGEQQHIICLYPYCWQEQPPAPLAWSPSSLIPFCSRRSALMSSHFHDVPNALL